MTNKKTIDYAIIPSTSDDSVDMGKNNTITIETSQPLQPHERIADLRRRTGMSRKAFCEYLGIPYRTVTEWERGGRTMPDYVLRLIEYQLKAEHMLKD